MSLRRARVLVVEDEMLIALDLADIVETGGGTVLGPAASVKDALAIVEQEPPDAAILDVNLADGEVTLVLDALLARAVPVLIYTGGGATTEILLRKPDIAIIRKPARAAQILSSLTALLGSG
jgi:DNA-binding NtrC family response regulator